jgi:hypothetical protein
MREQAISLTVQPVAGERCALAASAGLIGCAPDEPSKRFLATQTLDEARHVEIFSQRLFDLGVKEVWTFKTGEKASNKFATVHELKDGRVAKWSD